MSFIKNFLPIAVLALVSWSCARTSTSVRVNLVYGSEVDDRSFTSPARELIESIDTTVRVMYRYNGLDRNSWLMEPDGAFPKFFQTTGGTRQTIWEKASGQGLSFNNTSSIDVSGVPYRKRGFKMAIEFIQAFPIGTGSGFDYYVVAFGCYEGPTDKILTEAKLKSDLARGIKIYAGHTCGECPTADPLSLNVDNPNFTVDNLQTADGLIDMKCPASI